MQGSIADTARSIYSNQMVTMQKNSATVLLVNKNQNADDQKPTQAHEGAHQVEDSLGENSSPEAKVGFYQRIQR